MLAWFVGLSDPVWDLVLLSIFVLGMVTGHVRITRIGWSKTND